MAKRNTGSVRRRNKAIALKSEWRKAVAAWSIDPSYWQDAWGPPPGDPACLCPADILADHGIRPATAPAMAA